jgi:uncharacterized protein
MRYVFDANALIAIFKNEPGGETAAEIIDDPGNTCSIHAINLCEIYYGVRRVRGEQYAQDQLAEIRDTGLVTRNDFDEEFWQAAGRLKADLARVSLADCFCAALAKRLDAEVVTSDRHEMKALSDAGACRVRFIR